MFRQVVALNAHVGGTDAITPFLLLLGHYALETITVVTRFNLPQPPHNLTNLTNLHFCGEMHLQVHRDQ